MKARMRENQVRFKCDVCGKTETCSRPTAADYVPDGWAEVMIWKAGVRNSRAVGGELELCPSCIPQSLFEKTHEPGYVNDQKADGATA